MEDAGNYTCVVNDMLHSNNNTIYVKIYGIWNPFLFYFKHASNILVLVDTDEHFIYLTEENDQFVIDTIIGKHPSVQWIINVDAHPIPILEW